MFDYIQFVSGVVITVALYGVIFTFLYLNEKCGFVVFFKDERFLKSSIAKVLVFVVLPVIVAIVGLLVYYGIPTSEFDYIARFKNIGRIDKGSGVYYRGRNIGRVTSVYFSSDSAYVLAKFKIDQKGIIIYEGSEVDKISRSLTPRNLLNIVPVDDIHGKKPLKKGSILDEKPKENKDPVAQVLSSLYKDKKFGNILDNLEQATENFNKFSDTLATVNDGRVKDIDNIIKNSSLLIKGLNKTSDNLNSIIGDKETMGDIKLAITATKNTVQSVDKLVNNADQTVTKLGESQIDGNLDASAKSLSEILTDIKEITGDQEIKQNIKSLLNESNDAMLRLKCFSKETGTVLSKRFLLPRMIFGAPGKEIKHCFVEKQPVNE